MRAPPSLFLSELTAYRQWIASEHPVDEEALALLDRWRNHEQRKHVWESLTAALSPEAMPTPAELIHIVIERWRVAKRLDAVIEEAPKLEEKFRRHRAKAHIRNRDYALLSHEAAQIGIMTAKSEQLFGRKKASGSQRVFVKGWSDKFVELCGQPLNSVTAALTSIAFGREVTPNAVRMIRQAERSIRPPK